MTKNYDCIIIGAGIVGLATAYKIIKQKPHLRIAILDKEDGVAMHQTGHNSGVIHSGIYYKPGSLKAINCINGYNMMLNFCNKNEIKYELCGKLIVAINEKEIIELDKLYERGLNNGLDKIAILNKQQILEKEPNMAGIKAINVPYTGIINYTHVCQKLAELYLHLGGEIFTQHKVENIINYNGFSEIITPQKTFISKQYINCAGLYSDKVSAYTQHKIDTRIIPFRGEYYMLKPEKRNLINNLIYPVPDASFPFLGVHFTRMIDGGVEVGPNAVFAFKREGYKISDVDLTELMESLAWPGFQKVMIKYWKTGMGEFYRSFSKAAFTRALQRLVPSVQEDDLLPAQAGVRAQACDRLGGLIDDFKIIEDANAIHILNAPSPAATSSLSIGNTIAGIMIKRL